MLVMCEVNHLKEYLLYITMGLKGWGIWKKYRKTIRLRKLIKKWVIVLLYLRLIRRVDHYHRTNRYLKGVRK